ncbi:MAG: hypothetical protein DCC75_02965 [Proteobacteria bacterium]|nr:MAG: hypothetical protein DCC75_02965 [Pseudomonadota bacterium]
MIGRLTTFAFFLGLQALLASALLCAALAADRAASNAPPDSQNRIIKLTDKGLEPQVLKMKKDDYIVFFLNSSKDSLTTLEVDYGEKPTHCTSGNLAVRRTGIVGSTKPFGPRDFVSLCFHDVGTYPLTVYGLTAAPKGITGSILVE